MATRLLTPSLDRLPGFVDALREVRPHARDAARLPGVKLTTDTDNLASRKVTEHAGGVPVEPFDTPAAYGRAPGLRYRIALASSSAP